MNNKIFKVLFVFLVIIIIVFSGLKIYDYFSGTETFEYSKVKKAHYDNAPILSTEIIEKDLDSVFHKEICLDFDNNWVSEDNKKIICFEYNSGKLLVYKENRKNLDFSKLIETPADKVFSWNFHEKREDGKIIGEIFHTEKDTVMFWKYNRLKNVLIDDKGVLYNKINLNQ